jgi:hypothetical protein
MEIRLCREYVDESGGTDSRSFYVDGSVTASCLVQFILEKNNTSPHQFNTTLVGHPSRSGMLTEGKYFFFREP